MMKAVQVENFGGPEVLQIKTNLIVPPLTKTQVLVRVKCAGVNPVETYIREGQYTRYVKLLLKNKCHLHSISLRILGYQIFLTFLEMMRPVSLKK